MEILIFFALGGSLFYFTKREQLRRITLLASHLKRYDIEKLMESLMAGYLRALDDKDPDRQAQVWTHLATQEERLRDQLAQLAQGFVSVWADSARVSTLPMAVPFADKLFPAHAFDLRAALRIHAQGVDGVVRNATQATPKDRAYQLTAELMLLQHTCHWFCRSKAVASARLLRQHKTAYHQVLAGVSASTRAVYLNLVQGTR
jgi:hypothetical protein